MEYWSIIFCSILEALWYFTISVPLILQLNWRRNNKDLDNKKWPGIWIFEKVIDALKNIDNEISIAIDMKYLKDPYSIYI